MLEQSDPRIIVKVMVLLKFLGTVRIFLNGKEYKMSGRQRVGFSS